VKLDWKEKTLILFTKAKFPMNSASFCALKLGTLSRDHNSIHDEESVVYLFNNQKGS